MSGAPYATFQAKEKGNGKQTKRAYHGPEVGKASAHDKFLCTSRQKSSQHGAEAPRRCGSSNRSRGSNVSGITTENPPRTRAHVAKSSTEQSPRLKLIGRQEAREAATDNSRLPEILQPSSRPSEGS